MLKRALLVTTLVFLTSTSFAQRLNLLDVIDIYAIVDKEPISAVDNITSHLKKRSSSWEGPTIDRQDGFSALWRYSFNGGTYGRVQFVIQQIKGRPVAKILYGCPYIALYDEYVTALKAAGAVLEDNVKQPDGSLDTIYTMSGGVFILTRFPLSVSKYTVEGKPTAYFTVIMHPEL